MTPEQKHKLKLDGYYHSLRAEKTHADALFNINIRRKARNYCYNQLIECPQWAAALNTHNTPLVHQVNAKLDALTAICASIEKKLNDLSSPNNNYAELDNWRKS